MVTRINDRHRPLMIHRQRPRAVELTRTATRLAPNAQGFAVERKFLHPHIAVFDHIQALVGADRHVVRVRKLTKRRSSLAPNAQELTLGIEHLNPMIAAIGDINVIVVVDRPQWQARNGQMAQSSANAYISGANARMSVQNNIYQQQQQQNAMLINGYYRRQAINDQVQRGAVQTIMGQRP